MRNGAKTRGFTLIEILLVVFLIALMAITAITSYMNSTTTFKFLSSYQQVVSALRTARSYALSNKQQGDMMPKGYGVCVANATVLTFADTGQIDYKLDLLSSVLSNYSLVSTCYGITTFDSSGTKQDTVLVDKTFYPTTYSIAASDSKGVALPDKLLFYYEVGTGNLKVFNPTTGAIIQKGGATGSPYISVSFSQTDGLKRYIKVYQVSGLVEESTTP